MILSTPTGLSRQHYKAIAPAGRLAYMYGNGKGCRKNLSLAALWYKKESALQRGSYSQYQMGYCYYIGKVSKQDYQQAIYWFRKAANPRVTMMPITVSAGYLNAVMASKKLFASTGMVPQISRMLNNSSNWVQPRMHIAEMDAVPHTQDLQQALYWFQKHSHGQMERRRRSQTGS